MLALVLVGRVCGLDGLLHRGIGKECVGALMYDVKDRCDAAFEVGSADGGFPDGRTVLRGDDGLSEEDDDIGEDWYTKESI